MKLFVIIYTYFLLIPLVFGGCSTGTTDADDRRLGIRTNAKVSWAGSDSKLFANIYSNGKWNGWRKLDNSKCDDFVVGAVDYFDDFAHISSKWEVVSFYNCESDGVLIEDVWYWDGSNERQVYTWKAGVFGPFPHKCLYNDNSVASASSPNSIYSDILIDGDTECCDGVTFTTAITGGVWTGVLPGTPNCGSSTNIGKTVPVLNNKYYKYYKPTTDLETKLLNYLMIVIGFAVLLFVSNSCLITVMLKNKNKSYEYGKVYKTDME